MCTVSYTIDDPTLPACGCGLSVRAKKPQWAGALSLHLQGLGHDLGTWDSRIPCTASPELAPRSQSASPPSLSLQGEPCSQGSAGSGDWPSEGSPSGVWLEIRHPARGARTAWDKAKDRRGRRHHVLVQNQKAYLGI